MSSALVALVTAKKRTIRSAAAPDCPSNVAAASEAGRPSEMALSESGASRGIKLLDSGSCDEELAAGTAEKATAASPSVVENTNGIANLRLVRNDSACRKDTPSYSPCQATNKVRLDGRGRSAGNGALPICLILEDSCEVANKVNNTKDEAVFGAESQVRAASITGYGYDLRYLTQ